MPEPKRNVATDYRYGFQGQEKDDEIKGGEGNSLNYTFRMHDPRAGRFFAVDPLFKDYPYNSPYAFGENMVIQFNELEGLEVGTPQFYARHGMFGETTQKVVIGIEDGVTESLVGTWDFITRDAWSKETWKGLWNVYTEVADAASYGHSSRRPPPTPVLDAMSNSFEKNVINGDAYTRSKALSKFSTDVLTAYVGSKGLGTLSKFVNATVKTPWGIAKQSKTIGALGGAGKAKSGATLYRIGTTGKSAQGANAQFWSLENPLVNPEEYAKKYNVPIENIKNADFIETAKLKPDANFITREAGSAPGSANTGKGIEVVVEQGGTTNNIITPIKK